jgi:hypothetical protein
LYRNEHEVDLIADLTGAISIDIKSQIDSTTENITLLIDISIVFPHKRTRRSRTITVQVNQYPRILPRFSGSG